MVYGVLRFINFAHSDVLMLGAFAAYFLAPLAAKIFPGESYVGAALVIILAATLCAGIGILIEYLAYRPLRERPKLTVLITAIGVSLFIENACQNKHALGADTRPFPKLLPQHDFQLGQLTVDSNDVATLLVTGALLAGMWFIVQHTRAGMAMRAVAFNDRAAALMGVAGIFYALRAPGIDPLMGIQPGLRAFIAAVVGGIGNLPGAALGGLIIALLETFAGGIPGLSDYRDGIAFAVLILILLFKPTGLLGKSQVEKV